MTSGVTETPRSGRPPAAAGLAWHTLGAGQVLQSEGVDAQRGLSSAEAAARAQRFGPNKLAEGRAEPRWHAFLRQYADPMQVVLLAAGIGSLYPLKQLGTGILLILLTLANAVMGLQQEGKAAAAVAALQKMMIIKARVRRDGQLAEMPARQLVPGDIVAIEAGDVVPADGRLLTAATLEVAESALTGESLPAAKGTEPVDGADTPLGDRADMVYMNTNVTRGAGEFVVTATGMATEVGHISGMLQEEPDVKTPLTRQMDRLSRQILVIAGIALVASMALNLARGETFVAVFNAAVAFAIAAIPVGLPTVVTTILAYGTQQLAKAGAIMKRLPSTETLGSTSAINSDKTGTLTLNQMTAVQMVVAGRRYAVEGKGYSTAGRITRVGGQADIPLDEFLLPMVLASDAVVRDGELIGDPTEGALVVLAAKGGINAVSTRERYPRIAELPFDAAYKLMATFHTMKDASGHEVVRCYVKGTPDQLLARAAAVLDPDAGPVSAGGEFRQRFLAENQRLGEQGLRVIATARKDLDPAAFDPGADLLPLVTGLELLSVVGIVDPPRPTAKTSIAAAAKAGVRVRMITGDYAVTAAAIARQLGIDGTVTTGAEFGAMTDEEAMAKIDDIGVIARVSPEHKVRLVDVLRNKGQIVAMTGDGVNDAPAVKKADIGIAMGITGTEVTKEAAVMILTDDNFSTIVKAVELGRGLYDNLARYIRYQIGGLLGYIITFLGAAIFNIAQGIPLLDVERAMRDAGRSYDPGGSSPISVADLELARRRAGVEFAAGDIILLHTGFAAWYVQQARQVKNRLHGNVAAPGIEHTEAICEYLWNSHAAAIASDTYGVEVFPADTSPQAHPFGFLHNMLIGQLGMALGELWWLSDLASDCAADGVYEMFGVSTPMKRARRDRLARQRRRHQIASRGGQGVSPRAVRPKSP